MNNTFYNDINSFIYFDDDSFKTEIAKKISSDSKIICNSNIPVIVYLDDFGLPKKEVKKSFDNVTLNTICNEYLKFSIAIALLEKLKQEDLFYKLDSKNFLDKINNCFLYDKTLTINSLDKLLEELKNTKKFYKEEYHYYLETGNFKGDLNNVKIPYLDFEVFISNFRKLIGNKSQLCILIDNKNDVSIKSKKCVNSLMYSKESKSFIINVLTLKDTWGTFDDLRGYYVMPICSDYKNKFVRKK